jgi:hypothetical protein
VNLDSLRAAPPTSPRIVGLAGLIALAQLGALLGALLFLPWVWGLSFVVGVATDVVGHRIPRVRGIFGNAQVGLTVRALVRELGLVILIIQLEPRPWLALLLACGVPLTRGALLFLTTPERVLLRPGMEVRNLEFPLARKRRLPVAAVQDLVLSSLVIVPGALLGLLGGSWWLFLVTAGALCALFLLWTLHLAMSAIRHRDAPVSAEFARQANAALQAQGPELVLYFSGTPDAIYQVNMWLPVVERIGHPAAVVLRNELSFAELAPTTLPVISIPSAVDLMNFRMPTVRASFVVSHLGNNIHILREPRMKHVFIGHGESDKAASVNPITKGYDEVWVAGPASRRRWHQAKVGIRDDAIVEVGRPQLGGVLPPDPARPSRPLSVLYAPTWEGWIADAQNASSVADLGVEIVRWLIARPETRVIYKPHPLTGIVSSRARRAHLAMTQLIRSSGNVTELPQGASEDDWRAAQTQNLLVEADGPSLYDCFNHADVLIGDVSSVVPDFLASAKPYLIPNPHDLDHEEIRAELASTRAAYIMDSDPSGWEPLLGTAAGADPMEGARRELRLDILGPRYDDPVQPWREALTRLIARANAEWPDAVAEAEIRPE